MKLLVNADDLAKLISISRPTVERLVRANRIPSIRIGRRRLFDPNDVVKALKSEERE
jgi:excisionase family DNA binding protein